MRALVLHASHEGQTHHIADHVVDRLRKTGLPADEYNIVDRPPQRIAVDSYDAVMIGSPLHFGRHDERIASCIRQYRQHLAKVPTAFFSVSLGIASVHEKDRLEAIRLADQFLSDLNWEPTLAADFAGALRNSHYGFFTKRLMNWIAKKSGHRTDPNLDYEYTDWDAVETFSDAFAVLARNSVVPSMKHY